MYEKAPFVCPEIPLNIAQWRVYLQTCHRSDDLSIRLAWAGGNLGDKG
jgi:hypothetical protein